MGDGGMDALVALGAGDMRRTLNILQVLPLGLWLKLTCKHYVTPFSGQVLPGSLWQS